MAPLPEDGGPRWSAGLGPAGTEKGVPHAVSTTERSLSYEKGLPLSDLIAALSHPYALNPCAKTAVESRTVP
jgi:hypothetical protein